MSAVGAVGILALACVAPNPVFQPGLAKDAGAASPLDGGGGRDGTMPSGDADADPIVSPDLAAAQDVPPGADAVGEDVQPDGDDGSSDTGDTGAAPGAALGTTCGAAIACASGFCVDGVCCNSACVDHCWSCGSGFALGTCVPVPIDEDPREQCAAEAPSTCGRTGSCDGRGGCRLHPMGTECLAQSCTGAVATATGTCSGTGVCTAGATASCASGACTNDRCAVGCSGTGACDSGFACVGGRCTPAGPALHWRFDELPGVVIAEDASGNGNPGVYMGLAASQPSTDVAPTMFPNPRSREFFSGAAALMPVPASLNRDNDITLSFWFQARTTPSDGADPINIGAGDLFVRIRAKSIEFAKRRSMVSGSIYALAMVREVSNHLDGHWHHIAAVASISTGMSIYLDGMLRASDVSKEPILHTASSFWVGRPPGAVGHDFTGKLDDVRIYTRALGLGQIAALVAGQP